MYLLIRRWWTGYPHVLRSHPNVNQPEIMEAILDSQPVHTEATILIQMNHDKGLRQFPINFHNK